MTLADLPRILFLWILTPLVALISWRWLFGVEATMPFMAYHADLRPLAFFAHVGFAPVALAVLPFQFWPGLRRQRPKLHRWLGRVYGIAIVIAGLGGLALALRTEASPVAAWGFGLLAVIWLGVTGQAVALAMRRQIAAHQSWMIRSAALTLAAVTLRIYLPVLTPMLGFETAYMLVAWLAWVPNMILAEWMLQRRQPVAAV